MKYFLALDAHHANLDLKKLKVSLNKSKNMEYKFVPEEQRHILLCPISQIDHDEEIASLIAEHEPLELKLDGVWAYPNQDQGRLLWVGVQNSRELRQLQSALNPTVGADEEYKPNLPVVRLRNLREVSDQISPYKNADFGKILIDKVILYEMTSGGAFPTYKKIKEYSLKRP